jgi:hypothetical protein
MFQTDIEKTIVITAVVLWFAHGWYLNERLKHVHHKLDRVLDAFDGLRTYLYEIDPQFDDERQSNTALDDEKNLFAAMDDMELLREKKQEGKRTLNTSFIE